MSNLSIGETIKKYRMMAGYTQAELAEELSQLEGKNIAPSAIAGYESGQRTPKVEVRVDIARILGVDPVALSGIELNDTDEKRLLCKLLSKYAANISLKNDGTVNLDLPMDFAAYQMEYKECHEQFDTQAADVPKDSLEYELIKKSTDDELDYWVEMFPAFDSVSLCKEKNPECTLKDIKKYREMVTSECKSEFFAFQDSYLTPMMNKEIMDKIRRK